MQKSKENILKYRTTMKKIETREEYFIDGTKSKYPFNIIANCALHITRYCELVCAKIENLALYIRKQENNIASHDRIDVDTLY